jgi:3-hydroxybutyryl-CoA dehydrogenase
MSWELRDVAIVGGGMMGRSIATKVAQAGLNVSLKELSQEALESTKRELEKSLDHEIARFGLTSSEKKAILSRIRLVTTFDAIGDADLAIETVQEDPALKRQILRELDHRLTADHPIVINTSTLSITELAADASRPERILGMHFLYPVTTTRVVEVVRGQLTSDEVYERAIQFGRLLGKIRSSFEMPGFVTTRVALPLVNEAMHVVGRSPRRRRSFAMKLGYDFPSGRWSGPTAPGSTGS